MPVWIQKSQIGLNIGITYYFAKCGLKIIPNIRLGGPETFSSLEAYPKKTLISIGTNGFMKTLENREIFINQVKLIIDILEPIGVLIYGILISTIREYIESKGIKVYQYDSYTMKQNKKDREKKEVNYERKI